MTVTWTLDRIADRLVELGEKAQTQDEIPIAALILKDDEVIAEAFNQTESLSSFLAHAEILALSQATKKLGSKFLNTCQLYVSVEPCQMCFAAAKLSRIQSVFYFLPNQKFGVESSKSQSAYFATELTQIADSTNQDRLHHLLRDFFSLKRD